MTWSSLGWIMVQWVYPREGWFVCKEQKFNFFWRSSILQSLTPIKPLKEYRTQHHHCSLYDIDLSAQVWWNFLERTIEANWSGKIETGTPTTLPSLFPLVTLSAVYQILVYHTKGESWSTIPRGDSLTERNISQLWWILFSMCFQVKTCF